MNSVGVGYEPSLTGTGVRYSASKGYLHDNNVIARTNLAVLVGAQVIKLTFSATASKPTVTGIQFTSGSGKTVYSATATKEVILSAGAVDRFVSPS